MTSPSLHDWTEPEDAEEFRARVAEAAGRLPVMLTVREVLPWFVQRGQPVTLDEWSTAAARVGPNDTPWLVLLLHCKGLLDPATLAFAVADAWSGAAMPLTCLSRADWLDLFGATGYTVDGRAASRPTAPLLLYRGSRPQHRRRWSWTPDPVLAHWFADRRDQTAEARVFEVVAPPTAMLATFTPDAGSFRSESETVVNTRGLRIAEHRCRCERPR